MSQNSRIKIVQKLNNNNDDTTKHKLGFKSENIVFTDVCFHFKSGFKKILCSNV